MVARRDVVTGRPGVVSEALAGDREPEHDDHETDLLDHASDSTWPSLPTGIGPWCRDRLDHPSASSLAGKCRQTIRAAAMMGTDRNIPATPAISPPASTPTITRAGWMSMPRPMTRGTHA